MCAGAWSYARSLCKVEPRAMKLSQTFSSSQASSGSQTLDRIGSRLLQFLSLRARASQDFRIRIRTHYSAASARDCSPAPIATSRLRYHPLLTTQALSQDGTSDCCSYPASPRSRESPFSRHRRHCDAKPPGDRENTILTMSPTHRSVTPPLKSSRPSPPARAAPTSVFLSRTPARPPRPSTAGRSPAPSSTSRTSRATPRPSP